MKQYQNAADGLRLNFIARLVSIGCSIIMFIPIIGTLLGLYGQIACVVVMIVGLYLLSKDVSDVKIAFVLSIVSVVIATAKAASGGFFLLAIANTVIDFFVIYFVCKSVADSLKSHGMLEIADKGDLVWKINLICSAISIVVELVSWIPVLNILGAMVGALNSIASIVGDVIFFIFLYKSYRFYDTY
ncbi:MAG: hypothetical protein E7241_04895 [Lachnospiraceae bacterium]|nr:hypothetical protein [Lachnospiraceae bacterium]